MIDRTHDLPISRQAKALNISRGAVYYKSRPVSPEDLRLMRRIDELHLERPFAGGRMLRDFLGREGLAVGRRHVATLMKRMESRRSIAARTPASPRPATRSTRIGCGAWRSSGRTRSGRRTSRISRWRAASFISSPSSTGSAGAFFRIGCRSRWRPASASRRSRRRSANTASPRSSTATKAASSPARRSPAFFEKNGIAISMDGKGSWRDNVFVERLWRVSNTRRSTSKPTTPSPTPALRWAGIRLLQSSTPPFEP